jgi:hypothetical protein
MIRQFCAAVVVSAALVRGAGAESAPYVPYSGIIQGTDGAVAVHLTLLNATGADIACQAELAHWYSVDLGRAGNGQSVAAILWHDPATGRLNLLNETQHRMPVEAIWCGFPPGIHATRGRVSLPYLQGTSPAAMTATCTDGDAGSVICNAD